MPYIWSKWKSYLCKTHTFCSIAGSILKLSSLGGRDSPPLRIGISLKGVFLTGVMSSSRLDDGSADFFLISSFVASADSADILPLSSVDMESVAPPCCSLLSSLRDWSVFPPEPASAVFLSDDSSISSSLLLRNILRNKSYLEWKIEKIIR